MKKPNRRSTIAVLQSLTLHALLFAAFAIKGLPEGGEGKPGMQGPQQEPITAEIVSPPQDKDAEPMQEISKEPEAFPAPPTHETDDCTEFFGGVGLTNGMVPNMAMNRYDAVVSEVYPGYPAAKAGVQVGDILLDPDHIRGEIGTRFTLEVMRNGELISFDIIRDKICTSPTKGKNP